MVHYQFCYGKVLSIFFFWKSSKSFNLNKKNICASQPHMVVSSSVWKWPWPTVSHSTRSRQPWVAFMLQVLLVDYFYWYIAFVLQCLCNAITHKKLDLEAAQKAGLRGSPCLMWLKLGKGNWAACKPKSRFVAKK